MSLTEEYPLRFWFYAKISFKGIDKIIIIVYYHNNDYSKVYIVMSLMNKEAVIMEVDMPRIITLTCKRCKHNWVPRIPSPAVCPKCHSPYWNRPVAPKKQIKRSK